MWVAFLWFCGWSAWRQMCLKIKCLKETLRPFLHIHTHVHTHQGISNSFSLTHLWFMYWWRWEAIIGLKFPFLPSKWNFSFHNFSFRHKQGLLDLACVRCGRDWAAFLLISRMDNGKLQSFCVSFCLYPSNISTVVSAGDLEVLLSHSPAESLMQVSLTIGHFALSKMYFFF